MSRTAAKCLAPKGLYVMECQRWTRQAIRDLVQDRARGRLVTREQFEALGQEARVHVEVLTGQQAEMLNRLAFAFPVKYLPKFYCQADWPKRAFSLWLEGCSTEEIYERWDHWILASTIDHWIEMAIEDEIIQAFLAGHQRADLQVLADKLRINIATVYRKIDRYINFVSCTLNKEPWAARCRQAGSSGGPALPVPMRTCAGKGCMTCALQCLFDRYGNSLPGVEFTAKRLKELACFGIRREERCRHTAAATSEPQRARTITLEVVQV